MPWKPSTKVTYNAAYICDLFSLATRAATSSLEDDTATRTATAIVDTADPFTTDTAVVRASIDALHVRRTNLGVWQAVIEAAKETANSRLTEQCHDTQQNALSAYETIQAEVTAREKQTAAEHEKCERLEQQLEFVLANSDSKPWGI